MALPSTFVRSIAATIRDYIGKNILFVEEPLPFQDDDSFLQNGVIDSTGILEVQQFVEEEFGIEVSDEDIIPENFDSVEQLARYVSRKTSGR
jgi:acyl carrier protein